MPIKTKIGIVLVAVIAVFSVYQLSKYVHVLAGNGPTLANIFSSGDTQNCATCDPDHDGLTNAEEVLWNTDPFNSDTDTDGFKDGEEVASGHSPLIPGPDDLINNDNLTEQLSSLTVAGLAAGDLNPASASYEQTLADITSSVADAGKYLFNKTVSQDSLNIVLGNPTVNTNYVKTVIPIIQKFSGALEVQFNRVIDDLNTIGDKGFPEQLRNFYAQQAKIFEGISTDTLAVSVPKGFTESHIAFVSLARQMQTLDEAISKGDVDVIKATIALGSLGDIPDKYIAFLDAFVTALEKENVDMDAIENSLK